MATPHGLRDHRPLQRQPSTQGPWSSCALGRLAAPSGGFLSTLVAHNPLEQGTELRAAQFLRSQVRENKRMRLFLSSRGRHTRRGGSVHGRAALSSGHVTPRPTDGVPARGAGLSRSLPVCAVASWQAWLSRHPISSALSPRGQAGLSVASPPPESPCGCDLPPAPSQDTPVLGTLHGSTGASQAPGLAKLCAARWVLVGPPEEQNQPETDRLTNSLTNSRSWGPARPETAGSPGPADSVPPTEAASVRPETRVSTTHSRLRPSGPRPGVEPSQLNSEAGERQFLGSKVVRAGTRNSLDGRVSLFLLPSVQDGLQRPAQGKNLPTMPETRVISRNREDPLGKGMAPLQYSGRENPMDRGAVCGIAKGRPRLRDTFTLALTREGLWSPQSTPPTQQPRPETSRITYDCLPTPSGPSS